MFEFQIVRNVIGRELLQHLAVEFEITADVIRHFFARTDFGDQQSPNSFSMYSPLCFEALLPKLNYLMNEVVGKKLEPAASYARIYYNDAILETHVDRECAEYSTTICIDSTDLWNFYIEDSVGKTHEILLEPGDMCVYRGDKLTHWREPYKGEKQIQCFLHYVDSEGPNKEFILDKRPLLGVNKNQIFQEMFRYLYMDVKDIKPMLSLHNPS